MTTAMHGDPDPRPVLITGGPIHPMDGDPVPREAAVIRQGRVAGTGTREAMRSLAGSDARVLDVAGAAVLPGLVDTHPHLLHFNARSGLLVDIADARNHEDIVERIRARAAVTPAGEWIMTTPVGEPFYFIRRSWRDLEERRLPDRDALDQAAPDHPVFISAYGPVTPNVCAFNSAGLARVGITDFIPDRVCDVWIEKNDSGRVTGVLRGSVNNYYTFDPFWTQLLRQLQGMTGVDAAATTKQAMAQYNALGVTTVYEGHNMTRPQIGVYEALRAEEAFTVRVLAAMEAETYAFPPFSPLSMDAFMENLELARSLTRVDDDWLRISGVTISTGGPCWPGFLRQHEAYRDPYSQPTKGVTFLSLEKQNEFIQFCADRGVRANCVAGGYRDHDDFLDSCERLADSHPIRDQGWIIQHAILITEAQARRYARLGCDVTTSLSFCWGKGDLYGERIGRHAWRDLVPLQRLLDAGLVVGCGSDWGPKNIFEHLMLAQTHEFCGSGHRNDTPDHAVGRYESVLMWTRDAARVLRWDGVGTLTPGAHADVIVTDRDPLSCETAALPETQVLLTLLAGLPVHDAGALRFG
jgi:predicted amidohydrolase YtcJ